MIKHIVTALFLLPHLAYSASIPPAGMFLRDPAKDAEPNTLYCVAFSPDGNRALVTNAREPDRNLVVDVFDAETGQWLEEKAMWPSATLRNGFFVGNDEGEGKTQRHFLWDSNGNERLPRIDILENPNVAHWTAKLSADLKTLAVLTNSEATDGRWVSSSTQVGIYDLTTGNKVNQFPVPRFQTGLALFPDGKRLFTAFREIFLWEMQTGRLIEKYGDPNLEKIELGEHLNLGMEISPDGIFFATSGTLNHQRFVHVYESATGKRVFNTEASDTNDTDPNLMFSPDGLYFFWNLGLSINRVAARDFSANKKQFEIVHSGSDLKLDTGPATCPKSAVSARGDRIVFIDNDDRLTQEKNSTRERLRLVPLTPAFLESPPHRKSMSDSEVQRSFVRLSEESPEALRAIADLIGGGESSVVALKALFSAIRRDGEKEVPRLISQLDEAVYARRAAAFSILDEAGTGYHVPEIAHEFNHPRSAEVEHSMKRLVLWRGLLSPWEVRALRAIKTLEIMGTQNRSLRDQSGEALAALEGAKVSLLVLNQASEAKRRLSLLPPKKPYRSVIYVR